MQSPYPIVKASFELNFNRLICEVTITAKLPSRRYVPLLSLSSGAGVALGRAEEDRRRRRGVGRRLPPARTELVAEQRQLG